MVERSAAVSETGRVTDCIGDILLREADCLGHAFAKCEVGRDGRGQRAARAVRAGGVDLLNLNAVTGLAVKQYIHRTCDVLAALDEHVPAALGIDAACCLLHVLGRADFHICQILRLRYVRMCL